MENTIRSVILKPQNFIFKTNRTVSFKKRFLPFKVLHAPLIKRKSVNKFWIRQIMKFCPLTNFVNHAFTFSVLYPLFFSSFIWDDIINVDKQWVQPFYDISALSWKAPKSWSYPGPLFCWYTVGVDCVQGMFSVPGVEKHPGRCLRNHTYCFNYLMITLDIYVFLIMCAINLAETVSLH